MRGSNIDDAGVSSELVAHGAPAYVVASLDADG
jgi:hypothetical protein